MTAIRQRRARRTIVAATIAFGLVIAASVLFTIGIVTLSNSQEGEAVGVDTRPTVTFPPTPNALLAVTDDQDRLTSVVVLTLLPDGQGGSIVTVPVNADATAGFGLQRRPLDEFFDPTDLEGFTAEVEDMLSITIEQSEVVDPAGLEALLEPLGPVQVVLPDAVIDSDAVDAGTGGSTSTVPGTAIPNETTPGDTSPDGSLADPGAPDPTVGVDGVIVTAGPQILETSQIVEVLTSIDESVPSHDLHPIDVAMWSAIAQKAPVKVPAEPLATDELGRPVTPTTVNDLVARLFEGPVGVRDLAVAPASAATNPTGADVVVIDRADTVLVFAQISPSLVSTPNTGFKMRIEAQYTADQLAEAGGLYDTNSDLARELVGRLLFLQANIVSVDTSETGSPDVTIIEIADPALYDETVRAGEILFGRSEVRVATTVIEGVDIVVTLGASYLDHEVKAAAASNGAEGLGDTVPPDTVGSDG